MQHKLIRYCKFLTVAVSVAYGSVCAGMWFKQRDFVFTNKDRGIAFDTLGFSNTEVVWLKTPDGEKLESFYHPAPEGRPVVLFFHGKGSEISKETNSLKALQARNFGFLGVSYRGYGKSSGAPTEVGLITDANTAYDWLRERGIDANRIMVVGQSLGTGVATQLAAQKPVAALALGAPYTSTVEIAEDRYWYLPVRLLMKDQFWSSEFIDKVKAPLFILHGTTDKTIPVHYGQKLFELANVPKQIKLIEGQGHPVIFRDSTILEYANFFDEVFSNNLVVP